MFWTTFQESGDYPEPIDSSKLIDDSVVFKKTEGS